jgi:hypothetical protein
VSLQRLRGRSYLGFLAGTLTAGVGLVMFSSWKSKEPRSTVAETPHVVQIGLHPKTWGTISVEEALPRRRSIREYADKSLTIEQVMQLLWAAQGITLSRPSLRGDWKYAGLRPRLLDNG